MRDEYEFEWDPAKSASNAAKHGVSFDEAIAIWDDSRWIKLRARLVPEERWIAIGCVGPNKFLTAAITFREERIRIISARRSSKKEIDLYGRP